MAGTCAIVVCDHGLGHVRRCALMAKEREKTGEQVTLFAPHVSAERLQRAVPSIAGLTISDFATQTTPDRVRGGLPVAIEWLDRLPDLDDFDTVICDNLPEILTRRPDAMISAQFFWHDVIEGASPGYEEYCEQLLDRHKPTVVGCDLFAMEAVRHQPGFTPVGLYKNPDLVDAASKMRQEQRTDLLITGGRTLAVHGRLQSFVNKLVEKDIQEYNRVHVDERFLPKRAPRWIVKASYSIDMYTSLKSAICRPGLGVLTDLLTVGAEITCFYESGNAEMAHNADIVKRISGK